MMQLPTHIWPDTTTIIKNQLHIGGCVLSDLAAEFGTPLYLLDEATLRGTMRAYRGAFAAAYPGTVGVHYASKALLNIALAQIVAEEGLGLDVVSGAELLVARRAGLPLDHVHFHGNAKSRAELQRALDWQVGAIVIDNFDELAALAAMSANLATPQGVLLRVAPNIDAHTHAHIATGGLDSKFGLPLASLDAAVTEVLAAPRLRLRGLHAHIGSQLFDATQLRAAVAVLMAQAAHLRDRFGVECVEISPGGGLGVPYTADMPVGDIAAYAEALSTAVVEAAELHGLALPHLTIEPGRSIVARSGVALYRIVARKASAGSGVLPYLHIDGGMADNLRPALYGARYTALLANRVADPAEVTYNVAGRFCESGDVLLREVSLPEAQPGDLLAVAVAGAYTLSMASTYNLVPRPPLLLVGAGHARLIVRRETEDELLARDL